MIVKGPTVKFLGWKQNEATTMNLTASFEPSVAIYPEGEEHEMATLIPQKNGLYQGPKNASSSAAVHLFGDLGTAQAILTALHCMVEVIRLSFARKSRPSHR